jgi:tRNA pseudouridine65 synthase
VDYPLRKENGTLQDALTRYRTLAKAEIPLNDGRFPTSRYSLLEIYPQTGRFHQIRKHMKHIFHPILGDRPHGCNKQNRLWLETFGMGTMLLHARELRFEHPVSGERVVLRAALQPEFKRVMQILNLPEQVVQIV